MARLTEERALALAEEAFEFFMGAVDQDVHIRRSTNEFSVSILRGATPYRRRELLHEPPAERISRFVEGLHGDVPKVEN